MFRKNESFICKKDDGKINVKPYFVKNAWVASITMCTERLYMIYRYFVPMVSNVNLTMDNDDVKITWNPSEEFFTEVQYRTGSGEWTTVIVEKGIGEL